MHLVSYLMAWDMRDNIDLDYSMRRLDRVEGHVHRLWNLLQMTLSKFYMD